jgi:hypothetical protein
MPMYNLTNYKGIVNIEYTAHNFPLSEVSVVSAEGVVLHQSNVNVKDLQKFIKKLKREFKVDETNDNLLHMPEGTFICH